MNIHEHQRIHENYETINENNWNTWNTMDIYDKSMNINQ